MQGNWTDDPKGTVQSGDAIYGREISMVPGNFFTCGHFFLLENKRHHARYACWKYLGTFPH
jgi:hypothetical protein